MSPLLNYSTKLNNIFFTKKWFLLGKIFPQKVYLIQSKLYLFTLRQETVLKWDFSPINFLFRPNILVFTLEVDTGSVFSLQIKWWSTSVPRYSPLPFEFIFFTSAHGISICFYFHLTSSRSSLNWVLHSTLARKVWMRMHFIRWTILICICQGHE